MDEEYAFETPRQSRRTTMRSNSGGSSSRRRDASPSRQELLKRRSKQTAKNRRQARREKMEFDWSSFHGDSAMSLDDLAIGGIDGDGEGLSVEVWDGMSVRDRLKGSQIAPGTVQCVRSFGRGGGNLDGIYDLVNVRHIDAEENHLRDTRDIVHPLHGLDSGPLYAKLRVLNLRGNALPSFPLALLRHAPGLETLNLARNLIAEVPEDLPECCGALRHLNLSSNALRKLGALVRLTGLFTLDLSHNALDDLVQTEALVRGLGRLVSLNLAGNVANGVPSTVIDGGLRDLRSFFDYARAADGPGGGARPDGSLRVVLLGDSAAARRRALAALGLGEDSRGGDVSLCSASRGTTLRVLSLQRPSEERQHHLHAALLQRGGLNVIAFDASAPPESVARSVHRAVGAVLCRVPSAYVLLACGAGTREQYDAALRAVRAREQSVARALLARRNAAATAEERRRVQALVDGRPHGWHGGGKLAIKSVFLGDGGALMAAMEDAAADFAAFPDLHHAMRPAAWQVLRSALLIVTGRASADAGSPIEGARARRPRSFRQRGAAESPRQRGGSGRRNARKGNARGGNGGGSGNGSGANGYGGSSSWSAKGNGAGGKNGGSGFGSSGGRNKGSNGRSKGGSSRAKEQDRDRVASRRDVTVVAKAMQAAVCNAGLCPTVPFDALLGKLRDVRPALFTERSVHQALLYLSACGDVFYRGAARVVGLDLLATLRVVENALLPRPRDPFPSGDGMLRYNSVLDSIKDLAPDADHGTHQTLADNAVHFLVDLRVIAPCDRAASRPRQLPKLASDGDFLRLQRSTSSPSRGADGRAPPLSRSASAEDVARTPRPRSRRRLSKGAVGGVKPPPLAYVAPCLCGLPQPRGFNCHLGGVQLACAQWSCLEELPAEVAGEAIVRLAGAVRRAQPPPESIAMREGALSWNCGVETFVYCKAGRRRMQLWAARKAEGLPLASLVDALAAHAGAAEAALAAFPGLFVTRRALLCPRCLNSGKAFSRHWDLGAEGEGIVGAVDVDRPPRADEDAVCCSNGCALEAALVAPVSAAVRPAPGPAGWAAAGPGEAEAAGDRPAAGGRLGSGTAERHDYRGGGRAAGRARAGSVDSVGSLGPGAGGPPPVVSVRARALEQQLLALERELVEARSRLQWLKQRSAIRERNALGGGGAPDGQYGPAAERYLASGLYRREDLHLEAAAGRQRDRPQRGQGPACALRGPAGGPVVSGAFVGADGAPLVLLTSRSALPEGVVFDGGTVDVGLFGGGGVEWCMKARFVAASQDVALMEALPVGGQPLPEVLRYAVATEWEARDNVLFQGFGPPIGAQDDGADWHTARGFITTTTQNPRYGAGFKAAIDKQGRGSKGGPCVQASSGRLLGIFSSGDADKAAAMALPAADPLGSAFFTAAAKILPQLKQWLADKARAAEPPP